ncbi:TonB-dependent receptor [Caulobacter sp. BP25]|uniref:TonB-dependent receptor n=1 Tax=Caulobacter sp. BP25 TaxID=2048900 RepID=UPI00191BB4EA|nr:TonB-dependent receptor [Caulobacter sp. BP25]
MRNRLLTRACAGALLVLSVPAAAYAQDSEVTPLDAVVVTGEIIARPLARSGASVEVLDAALLADRPALVTVRDVLAQTANLAIVTGTGKAPTVRGVDGTGPAENANAFFAGSRPRLNWRIDGRPASYNEVVFGDLGVWDVARIEVLRGPQSTLVGRNAIAGTVLIETNDPKPEFGGAIQVVVGDYGQRQGSAMLNLPIVEGKLALRLAADGFRRQAATSYDSYSGVDDPGRIEGLTLRGKLLFTPTTSDSRALLTVTHTQSKAPNGEIIVRPFEARRSNFPLQPVHEPKSTSVGLDVSHPISETLKLELNASGTEFDFRRRAAPNSSNATIDTREYVLEPRLRYAAASGVSVVAGAYVYRARQDEFIEFFGGQRFDDRTDTAAAYVETVTPLSNNIDLSAGLRYEREKRQRTGGDPTGALVRIQAKQTYEAWLPKLGMVWSPSASRSVGLQISRGYNAGGGGITFAFPIVNYSYDAEYVWTGEVFGRQSWSGGRAQTTQNLFYSRYTDMQLPFDLTPTVSSDESFVVRNADVVETWGGEFGVRAALAKGLRAHATFGALRTKVAKYPGSGIEGNSLLTAPKATGSAGVSLEEGAWSAAVNMRYVSPYFTDVNNRARGRTDPYTVTDLRIGYDMGRARLTATVRNLFDVERPVARYPGFAPAGSGRPDSDYDSAVLLAPRMVSAGVVATF